MKKIRRPKKGTSIAQCDRKEVEQFLKILHRKTHGLIEHRAFDRVLP